MNNKSINPLLLLLIVCFFGLTSFMMNPKPHLIVGCWSIFEEKAVTLKSKKNFIDQVYFGSNEISSSISLIDNKEKRKDLRLAYRIYENMDGYNVPVLLFVNTCDQDFKLAFTIEKLTKDTLELKCIRDVVPAEMELNRETLVFGRIAGPPENMPDSEGAIEMEIDTREE
jgi:hypothetical protein